MPSRFWFECRDAGCFSFDSRRSCEREAREIQRDVIEAKNGCHELHTALNEIRDRENSKDEEKSDKE